MLKYFLIKIIKGLLWLLDKDHRNNNIITNNNIKKFTHIVSNNFSSDFGQAHNVYRTLPYQLWELKTTNHTLYAADKHLVVNENNDFIWIESLKIGDKIKTRNGIEEVLSVKNLKIKTHMYCISVESNNEFNHLYYSNGILSHNTTCSASYILWKIVFLKNYNVLVVSKDFASAKEVLDRIKFSYDELPNWLKPGRVGNNAHSLRLSNNSKVVIKATTPGAGRSLTINLLYCLNKDTTVKVRDKFTLTEYEISLEDLYTKL